MMFFTDMFGGVYRKADVQSMRYSEESSTSERKMYDVEMDSTIEVVQVDDATRAEIEQYAGDQRTLVLPTDGEYELITPHDNPEVKWVRTPIIGWKVLGTTVTPLTVTGERVGEDFSVISTRNGVVWMSGKPMGLHANRWLDKMKAKAASEDFEAFDREFG